MNTQTKNELVEVEKSEVGALALITLSPEKYAAEVYQPFKARLVEAIDSVKAIDYDIKTTAGMAVAIKARATFRDLRIDADKERKARKEPITKIGKLLESGFDQVEERIAPLEALFDADIKAEEVRKEAEKAAKIAAERARVEAIQGRIEAIRRAPLAVVGESSAAILITLELVRDKIIDDSFEELKDQAMAARSEAFSALEAAHQKAAEAETAALAAEQARLAEIARIAAEREELAQLRAAAAETARLAKIETDRIAAEQAAEAKRLRDLAAQQEAELQRRRDAAEAQARAEQESRAQAAAEQQRQLAEQQAEIEAQRAAFAREQEEARARAEAAAQQERDHAEALEINERGHYFSTTTFRDDGNPIMCNPNGTRSIFCDVDEDSGDEAERVRLQTCANQHLADARERANDERKAGMPAGSLHALIDDLDDLDPTDEEITAMGAECGLTPGEWVIRLSKYVAARELAAA